MCRVVCKGCSPLSLALLFEQMLKCQAFGQRHLETAACPPAAPTAHAAAAKLSSFLLSNAITGQEQHG